MLKQRPNNDENFIEYIAQGKVINISMPQYDFPSEKIRDLIANIYTCRLWFSCTNTQRQ